jgi:pimeloyl-ACP methyl ester carboxylesterase
MRTLAITILGLSALACQTTGRTSAAPPVERPLPHDAVDATIASSDGVPIRYHSEGRGEPALVFIHGWSCDRSLWSEQVAHFGAERQVIALDLAGHGDSGRDRANWTIESLGEDVRAVVIALDVRHAVLIGHSLGGPVALEAASRIPERVVAVIGIDTFHNVDRRTDPSMARTLLSRWEKDFAATAKQFVDFSLPASADSGVRQHLEDQFSSAPPEIALALLRAGTEYDQAAAFERVRAPIRAINTTLPSDEAAGRKHSANFAIVDLSALHLGHFPMLTAPQLFDQKLAETLNDLGVPSAGVKIVPPRKTS